MSSLNPFVDAWRVEMATRANASTDERQAIALECIAECLLVVVGDITERRERERAVLLERGMALYRQADRAGENFSVHDRAAMNGRGDTESLRHWERESERLYTEYKAFITAHPELREAIESPVSA